jgi:hypothetical protein
MKPDHQQQDSPQLNKSSNLLQLVLSVLATALIVGLGVYFATKSLHEKKDASLTSQQGLEDNQVVEDPTVISKPTSKETYFLNGWEGEYLITNLETGETKKFIPKGYQIVSQRNYDPFPGFLILEKDGMLFSFEIATQSVKKIDPDELILGDNEEAESHPSITEKDKFFISVNEYEPTEEVGMGVVFPVNTRSYFFDASSGKLTKAESLDLGCDKYDSRNQRIFSWTCAEGVGSTIPLTVKNLKGEVIKEIISFSDFDLPLEDNNAGKVSVQYNDGLLFAVPKNSAFFKKIIVINPASQEVKKEPYSVSDKVRSKLEKPYPYSMALIKNQRTFILGGSNFIALMRYGNQNIITETKIIPEKNLYANFIFPSQNSLLYQTREFQELRSIDLSTWEISKKIPVKTNEEVTLIQIKKPE